jgi:hypothetical protein
LFEKVERSRKCKSYKKNFLDTTNLFDVAIKFTANGLGLAEVWEIRALPPGKNVDHLSMPKDVPPEE